MPLFGCHGIWNWKWNSIPTGIGPALTPSPLIPSRAPPYSLESRRPRPPRLSLTPFVFDTRSCATAPCLPRVAVAPYLPHRWAAPPSLPPSPAGLATAPCLPPLAGCAPRAGDGMRCCLSIPIWWYGYPNINWYLPLSWILSSNFIYIQTIPLVLYPFPKLV